MRARARWLWLFLAGATACGESNRGAAGTAALPEGEPRDGAATSQPRRICPTCTRQLAGSETSDFSGGEDACSGDPAPAPSDADWNARLAEIRAVYSGPFEASLRWEESSPVAIESSTAFWQARPTGYEPVTHLSANIVLGAPQFFKGRPAFPDGYPELDCPDWFRVPASVELSTADGALAGTASGSFRVGNGRSWLTASLDLADAVGTLDLKLDPDLEYLAQAHLSFTFQPEGKRGLIELSVTPAQPSPERNGTYVPLGSVFPDDRCGASGFPRSADEPLAWLGQQTATEVLAGWSAELQRLTADAQRQDCGPEHARADYPVQLTFGVEAPQPEICDRPAWAAARLPGSFSFSGPAWLRSSDGRLDVPLAGGSVESDGLALASPSSRSLWSGDDSGLIPAAELEQAGIRGAHPGDAHALGYVASAHFHRSGGAILPNGSFSLESEECRGDVCYRLIHSDVRWPLDESAFNARCNLGTLD